MGNILSRCFGSAGEDETTKGSTADEDEFEPKSDSIEEASPPTREENPIDIENEIPSTFSIYTLLSEAADKFWPAPSKFNTNVFRSLLAPTEYVKPPATEPDETLEPEHIYGFRSRDTRGNLFYLCANPANGSPLANSAAFTAGTYGVVHNLHHSTQTLYSQQQREVTCMCLHPDPGIIATAELGVAPVIHVWSVDLSQDGGTSGPIQSSPSATFPGGIPANGRTKSLSVLALPENLDGVSSMAFTRDGAWLVAAGFSVDLDATPLFLLDWRRPDRPPVSIQGHSDRIFSVICNPFSRRDFVTVGVRHIKFWRIEMGLISDKATVTGEDGVIGRSGLQTFFSGCFTKQKMFVTGSAIGDIVMWKNGSKGPIYSIVPLENPNGFVTGGQDGRIVLWSDPTGSNGPSPISEIKFEGSGGIRSLDVGALGGVWWGWGDNFSRRASKVITNMAVGKRKSVDVSGMGFGGPSTLGGQRTSEIEVGTPVPASPISMEGSRPGTPATPSVNTLTPRNTLLVGCGDSTIWEVQGFRDESKVLVMEAHSTLRGGEVWGCAMHPVDSDRFATAGDDGWVKVWTVSGKGVMHRRNLGIKLRSCAWHPAGKSLAVGTDDGSFLVLTETLDIAVTPIKNRLATIHVLSYSPDGRFLAVGCHDNFLDVYAVEGENGWYQRVMCCRGHWSFVSQLDWSADSSKLRSNSGDNEVLFWALTLGEVMDSDAALFRDIKWATSTCPIQWGTNGVYGGKIGSAGERDVRLNYCDIVACDKTVPTSDNTETGLLVVGDVDGRAHIFRYPACHEEMPCKTYASHGGFVSSSRFSCDGKVLITVGGLDGCITQWRVLS